MASSSTIDARVASAIENLASINEQLADATPKEILEWSIDNLPNLYQTTAFGLTGCVTLDLVSRISQERTKGPNTVSRFSSRIHALCMNFDRSSSLQNAKHLVPLIFVDTLYHFPQTTDLATRAAEHYKAPMHIYTPSNLKSSAEFEKTYGQQLWERDEDLYDYLVKVEPARRAYEELNAKAVFTGRRRSQGADRASLQAVEVDETGLIKVNPLLNWSFKEVNEYVKTNAVPYNELLDMGYRSIGDWHSTALPGATNGSDADERSGRWKEKSGKTECGLHKDYFQFKRVAQKKLREAEMARKDAARDKEGDADASIDAAAQNTPQNVPELMQA